MSGAETQFKLNRRAFEMHLKSLLPEEILLEIFSKTDKSDLRNFLEISIEWRNLLIKNAKVMRKLPLILMGETWREKMEFVEKYGKFIRDVEFVDTKLEAFDDVLDVLRLTPNVEKLTIMNVKIVGSESEESLDEKAEESLPEKWQLRKLRELVVKDDEHVGILEFISSQLDAPLNSIKCNINNYAQSSHLQQLLSQSSQLKALEISSTLEEIFNPCDDTIASFTFHLDKLTINALLMKLNVQFSKFLSSQKRLKEIEFVADHVDFRYHQMIFKRFPALRKVQINIDTFATTDCLMKLRRIPANKSIRSLHLTGRNQHFNIFDAVIEIFPQLRRLTIQNLTQFYSDKLLALPLTHLRVDCVNREYLVARNTTKVRLAEKEVYAFNLQNFCDLSGLGDKNKDVIEAN